jgi:hypothetical protein
MRHCTSGGHVGGAALEFGQVDEACVVDVDQAAGSTNSAE